MTYYTFKTSPPRTRRIETLTGLDLLKAEEELPAYLMGIPVQSTEEARLGLGLWYSGFQFRYQVPVYGGDLWRGGYLLDFLVDTKPKATPVPVLSEYWHGGGRKAQDDFIFSRINHDYAREWNPVQPVWDTQLRSVSDALNWIRVNIGRQ